MTPIGFLGSNVKKLKTNRDITGLINLLADESHKTRVRAADALVELGPSTVPALLAALTNDDGNVRILSAFALSKIFTNSGDASLQTSAIEPLITSLKDPNPVVRQNSSSALCNIFTRSKDDALRALALEPLAASLRDEYYPVCQNAAAALDAIGWKPVRDEAGAAYWVAKGEKDKSIEFGSLAVEPLTNALKHSDNHWVRVMAIEALQEIGDKRAVESLIAALDYDNWFERRSAIDALGALGDERAIEAIIARLQDVDRGVRWHVPKALGQIGGERALEPIINALKHWEPNVRCAAARALGQLGGERAKCALEQALTDKDKDVRRIVGEELLQITSEVGPVEEEPVMERIREVHLFIEGGGDQRLVDEIIQALHPEFLRMPGLKIHKHDVTDWPAEPFYLAATDLRIHHGIQLTTTNCITQDGSAYGKRLYLIMVK